MNISEYQEKREAKKERFQNLAERFQKEGADKVEAGYNRLKQIPFGQPILVGHHSEKSDRSYRSKSCGMIDKGYEIQKKADYYQEKAERMENNTAISSDDPEAVQKLTAKLAGLQEQHEKAKQANKDAVKAGQPKIYPAYVFANNNGNMKRIKERIASLSKIANTEAREDIHGEGWTVKEDKDENRILFIFEGIPAPSVRDTLKRHGFKWSPSRTAWVRQLNDQSRYAVRYVIEWLYNNK